MVIDKFEFVFYETRERERIKYGLVFGKSLKFDYREKVDLTTFLSDLNDNHVVNIRLDDQYLFIPLRKLSDSIEGFKISKNCIFSFLIITVTYDF